MTRTAVVVIDEQLRPFVVAALLYGKRELRRNGTNPPPAFDMLVESIAVRSGQERSFIGTGENDSHRVTVSIAEAARRLGVSESTVRRAVGAGRLACVAVGRRRLIPVRALDELANGSHREAS